MAYNTYGQSEYKTCWYSNNSVSDDTVEVN